MAQPQLSETLSAPGSHDKSTAAPAGKLPDLEARVPDAEESCSQSRASEATRSARNGVPTANTASLEVQSVLRSARTCRSAQKNIPAGTPKARRRSRLGRRGSGIRELTSNCNNIISLLGRKSTREKMPETDARGVVSMCLRARAACFTTLTGGNKTTHSRKSTLRPGGGRQGRREETARGSNEVFCSKRPSLRTDSSHSGCLGSWCMKRQFQDGLVV